MRTFNELRDALNLRGLTLSRYTPNKNLSRKRYYVAEGYNTLAGFDTLEEVSQFYEVLTKKEKAAEVLRTGNTIREEIKEVVSLSPYGNIYGLRNRSKLVAAMKKARAIAEWNIDLRMNNKDLLYWAAKFLGVEVLV